MAAIPQTTPIPAQIEFSADQIMLGGRPLQNFAAGLQAGAKSLGDRPAGISGAGRDPRHLERLERASRQFHRRAQRRFFRSGCAGDLAAGPRRGGLSQPEAAAAARRSDRGPGSRRDRSHEGRDRWRRRRGAGRGFDGEAARSRFDAELKAERLDLDAATALARSLAGPQAEWPDEAQLIARYRPRHIGRSGTAAVDGEGRLRRRSRSRWSS